MRRHAIQEHTALLLALALTVGQPPARAQTSGGAAPTAAPAPTAATAAATFSAEQLEQLVAPVALYADSLLMQIFMASTYPLEIVLADRFMQANPGVKDAQLDEKLKEQDWDPSVKSLCKMPDVLKKMSENLDWTQDLGDAFLAQKTELLDSVQRMRGKANDSGNLKTTPQQTVTVKQDKIIVIESPSPEVVYVPTYSPTVVYGGWSYPSYYYPTMYPYYPPGAGLVSFGVGMAVGAAIWGGCNWGWGRGDVNVNVNRYNNFNRNTNINANRTNLSGNRSSWQHNSAHRQGVNYRNSATASKYGGQQGSNRVSRDQARGHSGASSGTRQARTPSAGTTSRDGSGSRQGSGSRTPSAGTTGRDGSGSRQGSSGSRSPSAGTTSRDGSGSRQGSGGSRSPSATTQGRSAAGSGSRAFESGGSSRGSSYGGSSRGSAYSGSSSPRTDSAASSRGASSRGTSSYGGSRGSGSYGGSRGSGSYGGSRGGGSYGGGGRGGGGGGGRGGRH